MKAAQLSLRNSYELNHFVKRNQMGGGEGLMAFSGRAGQQWPSTLQSVHESSAVPLGWPVKQLQPPAGEDATCLVATVFTHCSLDGRIQSAARARVSSSRLLCTWAIYFATSTWISLV